MGQCTISDKMLLAAAEAICDGIPDTRIRQRGVFPALEGIRDISARVALSVLKQAREEGLLGNPRVSGRGITHSLWKWKPLKASARRKTECIHACVHCTCVQQCGAPLVLFIVAETASTKALVAIHQGCATDYGCAHVCFCLRLGLQVVHHLDEGDDAALEWIQRKMYVPMYGPMVQLPAGEN